MLRMDLDPEVVEEEHNLVEEHQVVVLVDHFKVEEVPQVEEEDIMVVLVGLVVL